MKAFSSIGLLPALQEVLSEKGIEKPTEVQSRAMPALLCGKSVVGVSETGSGKTLAYALPMLHLLKTMENEGKPVVKEGHPRAAVIVPSRELGEQVTRVFKTFTHSTRLRVRAVLGGSTMEIARRSVKGPFDILVATPGRLLQLMEKKILSLSDVRLLVFDEADQMLDKGFLKDANTIARSCKPKRQLGLFSATVSMQMEDLIKNLFSGAEIVRTIGSQQVVSTLKTLNIPVTNGERFPALTKILAKPGVGGTLIFTNTRAQCDALAELLTKADFKCLIYRGEMDKLERKTNLKAFRDGKVNLMISTDLAGRGIDVDHISRVINYHLPKEMKNYLHRVGRTARAGRKGVVFNLVTERDKDLIAKLAK
jgi:superfamily II DNA/RNA helicase